MVRCTILMVAGLFAGSGALAGTPFDGVYFPTGAEGWDCKTVGMDTGALAIANGRLEGVENSCALANPVTVRDLPAVLYDLTCTGEGMTHTERVMLMRSDDGVYVIRDGFVAEWSLCD